MTRILFTDGKGSFSESTWDRPPINPEQIMVRSILTGVCRSDIDMMQGKFNLLPINMSGHEGLGQVLEIGSDIHDVKIGDYVATRGEPAYADFYNVNAFEYVPVPAAEPDYIIEPVACGINLIYQPIENIMYKIDTGDDRILILGSGFLAWVAYHTIQTLGTGLEIDVVGRNNTEIWGDILQAAPTGTYDIIIDLSSGTTVFDSVIYNENALIIMGSQKTVTTDFGDMLWKSVTMTFPSPRNPGFYKCMRDGVTWISNGYLEVDGFWSKGYDRDTEWLQAFEDAVNRPKNYSRGYIKWA